MRRFVWVKLMKGFVTGIEKRTKKNSDFRHVLYTGRHSQLVLMRLKPREEIGMEVHKTRDQFFRFEKGNGKVIIDGVAHRIRDGSAVIVPAGARHNVVNTSRASDLRMYTIYSPPEHQDKVIRHTKREAMARPEEFDGRTTE
jgi:mannose-6-phosphate isomerase-like protein (cupin superfamily)